MLAQGSAIIRNNQNYEIKINVSAELGTEGDARGKWVFFPPCVQRPPPQLAKKFHQAVKHFSC